MTIDPKIQRTITGMVRNQKVYQDWHSIVEWEKKQLIEDGVITPEETEFDIDFELRMGVESEYRSTNIGMCTFSARPRYYVIKKDLPQDGDRYIGDSYSNWGEEIATLFGEEVEELLNDEGIRARIVSVNKIDDDYDAENYRPAISKYVVLSCKIHITER